MPDDQIRYDILASEAMRGIIRTVLQRAHKRGLPGEHHFFITFDTTAPGTIISKRLKEQYPEEMVIVLQHQFWDLFVYEDRFEVKLSFNGVPERLVVPFSSIKTFLDPSVSFGFSPNLFVSDVKGDTPVGDRIDAAIEAADRVALPRPGQDEALVSNDSEPKPNEGAAATAMAAAVAEEEEVAEKEDEPEEQQTAKVVELDLFRKNK